MYFSQESICGFKLGAAEAELLKYPTFSVKIQQSHYFCLRLMVLVQQFLPTPTKSHLRDFKQFQVKISSIPGTEILLSFRS